MRDRSSFTTKSIFFLIYKKLKDTILHIGGPSQVFINKRIHEDKLSKHTTKELKKRSYKDNFFQALKTKQPRHRLEIRIFGSHEARLSKEGKFYDFVCKSLYSK